MVDQHFHLTRSLSQARIWSTFRAPFEPRTEKEFELRYAIQTALDESCMYPQGELLSRHAVYAGPEGENCDLENVTCYDVGRWKHISLREPILRIERSLNVPDSVMPVADTPALHYWHYALRPLSSDFVIRKPQDANAVEIHADMPTIDFLADPKHVWYAVKVAINANLSWFSGWKWLKKEEFGICVRVLIPAERKQSLRLEVKPILDGVMAAIHQHKSPNGEDDLRILAEAIQKPLKEIRELATMKKGALLGPHRVFIQRAGGIQVSPRDDRCVAIDLRYVTTEKDWPSIHFCVFDAVEVPKA